MKRRTKKSLAFLMSAAMLASAIAPTLAMAEETTPTFDAISDLHYTAQSVTDGTATKGLLLSKADAILDAALAKSTSNILFITGDLTENGTQAEHTHVAEKLAAYKDANPGKQIFVVPGEHDLQSTKMPNAITKSAFAATYRDFGYASGYDANLNYTRDLSIGGTNVRFVMMNSVGDDGNPAIDAAYAKTQTEAAAKYNVPVVGVVHHPSVSRGGVDYNLMGLLYSLAGVKDLNGNPIWTGDTFAGLDLNDASSFSYEDAQTLALAGMKTFLTGDSLLMATANGSATNAEGEAVAWTDYCNGSMVGSGAGVRTLTLNADKTFTSNVNYVDAVAGSTVNALATAAYRDYMPTAIDEIIARAEPVLIRALEMVKEIGLTAIDQLDISSIVPSGLQGLIKGPVKDLIGRIINDLKGGTALHDVLGEVKTALINTAVPTSATTSVNMLDVLTEVIVTLQHDNTQVAPSLQPMVAELKAGTTDGLAAQAVRNFADELAKDCNSTIGLINTVLNEELQIVNKNSLRAMLSGPVKFGGILFTFNLWDTIDGAINTNPDGTPIPPEYKPSVLYRPLVDRILLMDSNPAGNALTAERFTSGIKDKAADIIQIALDGGLADII